MGHGGQRFAEASSTNDLSTDNPARPRPAARRYSRMAMHMQRNRRRAFTLVELLVVIAIIPLISAIGVLAILSTQDRKPADRERTRIQGWLLIAAAAREPSCPLAKIEIDTTTPTNQATSVLYTSSSSTISRRCREVIVTATLGHLLGGQRCEVRPVDDGLDLHSILFERRSGD